MASHVADIQQEPAVAISSHLSNTSPAAPVRRSRRVSQRATDAAAPLAAGQADTHGRQQHKTRRVAQAEEPKQQGGLAACHSGHETNSVVQNQDDAQKNSENNDSDEEDSVLSDTQELPEGCNWPQHIWEALQDGVPPSSFTCSFPLTGRMPGRGPKVTVEGVGQLVLPLSPEQAAALRGVAEQAPYGKGKDTVVDISVRSALQVDASKVTIRPNWKSFLRGTILPEVAEGLGLMGPAASSIRAELYKLLLYERGGHFAAHRDTEKAPRMFATLVVQLHCAGGHEGGKLLVRHGGREVAVDTAQESGSTFHCTAFFADCEHQLLPITMGRRLVLAYNLCWTGQGRAPNAPDGRQSAALAAAVRAWERELAAGGSQERLALPLEHKYTTANLSFSHLKGGDRRVAQVAAACPLLDCHLALLTRTVSGAPETSDDEHYYHSKGWMHYEGDDEDEEEEERSCRSDGLHTMEDVYDDVTSTVWRALDGSQVAYPDVRADSEFFHPEGDRLFDSDNPDEEEYEGYTGNTSPSLDYIYHRALLVLWPRTRSLVLARATGVEAVLSLLAVSLQAHTTGSTGDPSAALEQVQQALDAAIDCFRQPQPVPSYTRSTTSTPPGCALAYALQLLLAAHAAGLPAAEQAASRLLAARCWGRYVAQSGARASAALVNLLAAFKSDALNAAAVQLVQRLAAVKHGQAQACEALVAALAALPEVQRPAALAAADALLKGGHAAFTSRQPASVLALSEILLSSAGLAASHYERFAKACLRRRDRQELLQELLKSPKVAAATALPAVQELVAARMECLQAQTAAAPTFSWRMPEASLPEHPQVEAFLLGPKKEATFNGPFNNVRHARNWGDNLFNYDRDDTYSARAEARGSGSRSYCQVVKTREWHNKRVQHHKELLAELQAVKALCVPAVRRAQLGLWQHA